MASPMVDGWLVFLGLLTAYLVLVFVLVQTGWLGRLNMSLFLGVALMVKTGRGRVLLDWFARARGFFDKSAFFGLFLTGFVMFAMTALLVWQLTLIARIPADQAPSPDLILGIPGINPLIPVFYGIVALIFAVVVHEFSHGIMARVYDLKVRSMGILLFIVPIGAFVEPDEDEMKATTRMRRSKVFSAGPLSNIVFAILFAFVFSTGLMAQAGPVDGVPVQAVEAGGPAQQAGVHGGWVITAVNGTQVACASDISALLGNTTEPITPGTEITLTGRVNETERQVTVTTARRADLYDEDPDLQEFYEDHPDFANGTVVGLTFFGTCAYHDIMARPLDSGGNFLFYVSLPFLAIAEGGSQFPLNDPYTGFFETPFHAPTFWVLANLAYWLFWINLMLGLTNALPLLPLDGGHMFKDFVDGLLSRLAPAMEAARRTALAGKISGFTALFILLLVLAQFFGPALIGALR
jgi:membrane-associated protease RseP (regulator of RpoE activity)